MQKYFNTGQAGSSELCALKKKILFLNLKFVLDAAFSISVTSEEDSRCLLENRKCSQAGVSVYILCSCTHKEEENFLQRQGPGWNIQCWDFFFFKIDSCKFNESLLTMLFV